MYSEGQKAHMRWLATLDPTEKCWCGWYKFGDCPNQPHGCCPGKTNADKMRERKETGVKGA